MNHWKKSILNGSIEISQEVPIDNSIHEEEDVTNIIDEERKKVWYHKVEPFLDLVHNISMSFIHTIGTYPSIDEIIILISGRSQETHRIKNKPKREGFKLYVLATYSGYIINFTTDGRTAINNEKMKYEIDPINCKIQTMLMFLVEAIKKLREKQTERI